jgi:hypothetical protein
VPSFELWSSGVERDTRKSPSLDPELIMATRRPQCASHDCGHRCEPGDWFCTYCAALRERPRCGWGGGMDDPAPCSELARAAGWLCERHAEIIGKAKRLPPLARRPLAGSPQTPKPERSPRTPRRRLSEREFCKNGHPTAGNVFTTSEGRERCRACRREQGAASKERVAAKERRRDERSSRTCEWPGCATPITGSAKRCAEHRRAHEAAREKARRERQKQGYGTCAEPACETRLSTPQSTRCRVHASQHRARQKAQAG